MMSLLRLLNKQLTVRLCVLVALVSTCGVAGAEPVEIVNTTPEPIRMYLWEKGEKKYTGPFFVAIGDSLEIDLGEQDRYYIAYQDQLKRNIYVGWVNLREVTGTTGTIGIDTLYQQNGWFLGWRYVDGYRIPRWSPIGRAYAWRASMRPLENGDTIVNETELIFRNARHLKFSLVEQNTYYFNYWAPPPGYGAPVEPAPPPAY